MSKPRILLIGDSRRDTYGIAAVGRQLSQSFGMDVFYSNFQLWGSGLREVVPHIIVLNHVIGERNRSIARAAKSIGCKVVVMPTEGRPNTLDQAKWYEREHVKNKGLVDLILPWNEQLDFGDIPSSIVGSPRFDAYANKPMMEYLREKTVGEFGSSDTKKIVGVFSSFPQAKFSSRNASFNENDWRDLNVVSIKGRENPKLFARQEKRSLEYFINKTLVLADENPEIMFIVKPHPMEDTRTWGRRVVHIKNIKLSISESSYEILAGCDLSISRYGCMTALESALAGVPNIQLGEKESDGAASDCYVENDGDAGNFDQYGTISPDIIGKYLFFVGSSSKRAAKAISSIGIEKVDSRLPLNGNIYRQLWMKHAHESVNTPVDSLGHVQKNMTARDITEASRWIA